MAENGEDLHLQMALVDEIFVRNRPKRRYRFGTRTLLGEELHFTDYTFRRLFRMYRPTFEALCRTVAPHFTSPGSTNGKSLCLREQILHYLYFVGGNGRYIDFVVNARKV